MKMKQLLTTLLLLVVCSAFAQQTRKVLVIGIDGTRSDALQQANTPNLDGLIANGLYTWNAWHCGITVSAPSWSDIMCGVWEAKHGVTSNSYTNSHYDQYPYFPQRAKEFLPDLYCVQVTEWAPMSDNVYNDGWDVKIKVPDGQGTPTADAAVQYLAVDSLDCMFVYFDAVDLAGHASGFAPSNPNYMAAIEGVDGHIGTVLNALYARPNYANEDWLILVITDHGGIGTGHGGNSDNERHIWWIASGNAVTPQELPGGDPGTYWLVYQLLGTPAVDDNILATSPVQTDIGVTALHHLIYETGTNPEDVSAWDLDGKSWLKVFTAVNEKPSDELIVTLYPNPASDLITLWYDNAKNEEVTYSITDVSGKKITASNVLTSKNKMTFDLTGNAPGMYLINIAVGTKHVTKSFVIN